MRYGLQRSLQNMCRIASEVPTGTYAEYASGVVWKRINSLSHPEIIKFLVKFLVFQPSDSNPRPSYQNQRFTPAVVSLPRLARPLEISAIHCQVTATTGPYDQKFGGIALHARYTTIMLYKPDTFREIFSTTLSRRVSIRFLLIITRSYYDYNTIR